MENSQEKTLTRESIARAALALADRIGIENVSARKLAAVFDKSGMALYRYYGSIDEIKAAALALALEEVDADPCPGEAWDDTVKRTTASIREMYLRHARANLLLADNRGDSPGMVSHTQRVYALHEAQGIPPDVLSKLWRMLDAFLGGFLAGELNEINSPQRGASLSAEQWRNTVGGAYHDEAFSDGIDIIIAGIRTLAAPDPCNWATPDA